MCDRLQQSRVERAYPHLSVPPNQEDISCNPCSGDVRRDVRCRAMSCDEFALMLRIIRLLKAKSFRIFAFKAMTAGCSGVCTELRLRDDCGMQ
jgi:hypothetical protein